MCTIGHKIVYKSKQIVFKPTLKGVFFTKFNSDVHYCPWQEIKRLCNFALKNERP